MATTLKVELSATNNNVNLSEYESIHDDDDSVANKNAMPGKNTETTRNVKLKQKNVVQCIENVESICIQIHVDYPF